MGLPFAKTPGAGSVGRESFGTPCHTGISNGGGSSTLPGRQTSTDTCARSKNARNTSRIRRWASASRRLPSRPRTTVGRSQTECVSSLLSERDCQSPRQSECDWGRDLVLSGDRRYRRQDAAAFARSQTELRALFLVSAWSVQRGMILGRLATAEKSNEITAIPELIDKEILAWATT